MQSLTDRIVGRKRFFAFIVVCLLVVWPLVRRAESAPFTWNGGGADNNWGTVANWVGGAAPANDGTAALTFNGTTRLTPQVDAPWSLSSITFDDTVTAGAFTVAGSGITFSAATGVVNSSATGQAINSNLTAAAAGLNLTSTSGALTFGGGIDLSAGGGSALAIDGGQATTIAGVVSGTGGSLAKAGTGTLTLSGANTYTGATALNAGTLAIGTDTALGTGALTIGAGTTVHGVGTDRIIANAVTIGGDFAVTSDDIMDFSGTVDLGGATRVITLNNASGGDAAFEGVVSNGGIDKQGDGILILDGNNTYAGGTTLTAGTLAVAHDNALGTGGLTIAAGTTLSPEDGNRTIANAVTVNGDFTIAGDAMPDPGDPSVALTLTGNMDLTTGTRTVTVVGGGLLTQADVSGVISNGGLTKAGTGTLILSGTNTYTGTTTVNAGTLTLNGGSAIVDTGAAVLANTAGVSLTLGASETIGSLAGGGSSGGNLSLGGNTLTVGDATNTTYAGVVSGAGGSITKAGTGKLTLSGANTYTGATALNTGTLAIGTDTALGTGTLTIGNGTTVHGVGTDRIIANAVTVGGDFAITSDDIMDFSGTVDLGGAMRVITLTQASGGDAAFEGVVSNGGIDKQGDGILILDGNNTYAGGTTLTAGTLAVTHNNALGTGGLTIAGGTTFAGFDTNRIIANAITVNGNFTIDGDTMPDPGVGAIEMLFSGTVDLGGTARTITINNNNLTEAEITGVISNGGLIKNGSGLLILTGNNTYAGNTTLTAGTLALAHDNALGTGGLTLAGGTLVALDANRTIANAVTVGGDFTIAGDPNPGMGDPPVDLTLTGAVDLGGATRTITVNNSQLTDAEMSGVVSNGGLTKAGTGTLILSGTNTYTGTTTVNAGTLTLNGAAAIVDTGAVVLANTAGVSLVLGASETIGSLAGGGTSGGNVSLGAITLTVGDATNTTYAGVISGAGGSLTKQGTGTFTLSGTNTYTGTTTLNAGTLAIGNAAALGTGTLTIGNGTTVHGVGTDRTIANAVTVGGDFAITSDDVMDFSGTVDLGGATRAITLTQASGGDAAFDGVVSNGGIDKQGDGILILTGNNTYAGGTTLTAGTLAVAHNNALGTGGLTIAAGTTVGAFDANRTISNAVTVGGDFTIDGDTMPDMGDPDVKMLFSGTVDLGAATRTITVNTNTLTDAEFSGVISNGGLTKAGTGALILSGTNTYTGTTTLNAGTLTLNGGSAIVDTGAVVLANTAGVSLTLGASETIGSLAGGGSSGGNLTLGGNTLTVGDATNTTYAGVIGGTGNLVKQGSGTLTLGGVNTFSGSATLNAGTLEVGASASMTGTVAFTLAGGTFQNNSGQVVDLNGSVTVSGNATLAGADAIGVSGAVDLGGATRTLTITNTGGVGATGVVSNGGIDKQGTGILTLSGANTYAGGTTLTGGTVVISNDTALGTGGLTIGNGTTVHGIGTDRIIANNVTVGGDFTITSVDVMDFSGTVDLGGATRVITVGTGGDSAFDGVVSNGGIDKQGAGILILTGNNTYTGNTTLTAGTLTVGHNNALGTGGLTIAGGTTLGAEGSVTLANTLTVGGDFTIAGDPADPTASLTLTSGIDLSANRQITVTSNIDATLSGVISESGGVRTLTVAGNRTLTLSGVNTYTGGTALTGGTLLVGDNAALGTGALTVSTGTSLGASGGARVLSNAVTASGNFNVTGTNDLTLGGVISGAGGITKSSTGALVLSGTNTYTGTTTINAGAVTLSGGAAIADTGAVVLANATGASLTLGASETIGSLAGGGASGGNVSIGANTLTVGDATNTTYAGVISGTGGALVKAGSGTLTLTGANTFTGSVTHNAGTIEVGSSNSLGTGGLTLANGATLGASGGAVQLTNALTIGNAFGFSGTQDLTLTDNLALASNLAVTVTGSGKGVLGGVLSGGFDLAKLGTGTLELTGTNTYTGNTNINAGVLLVTGSIDNSTVNLGGGQLVIGPNGSVSGNLGVGAGSALSAGTADSTLANDLDITGDFAIDGANDLTLTGTVDLMGAVRQISVQDAASTATITTVIAGTGGVTKAGNGTLTLSGANTYSGGTAVNTGTLIISGSVTGTTAVAGGTLALGNDNALGTALTLTGGGNLQGQGGARTIPNTVAVTVNGDFGVTGTQPLDIAANITLGATPTVTTSSTATTTLSGIISGAQGLTKAGTGTLTLTGTNTYTGTTTLNAGTLVLNGVVAGDVLVNAAGTFQGGGTINGNVTVSGIFNAGNSPGTINIGGNLTLNAGSTTVVEIASTSLADQYVVTGSAALDGTLQVTQLSGYAPADGDAFTILTAGGGVTGTFGTLAASPAGLAYNIVYNANDVAITISAIPYTNSATTSNQTAVATVMDTIRATATGDWLTVTNELNTLSTSQLQAALNQIVPEELGALSNLSFSNATVQSTNVSGRLAQVRNGHGGHSTQNLRLASLSTDPQNDLMLMALSGNYGQVPSSDFGPVRDETWSYFVSGAGTFGEVDSTSNQAGYDFYTAGLTFGADKKISDRIIVGIMSGYAHSNVDIDSSGGKVDVNSIKVGVYGSYFDGGFHADAMIGGGYHFYNSDRKVQFGAISRTAGATPDALELNVMASAGYDFEIGQFKVGPTASIQYSRLSIESYTESGGGALNLKVSRQTAESILATVGVRAATMLKYRTVRLIPEIRVSFQHDFEDQSRKITARFAVGGGGAFGFNTTDIGQDSALIGAGVTIISNSNWTSFIDYSAEVGRKDYVSHSLRGGIKFSF